MNGWNKGILSSVLIIFIAATVVFAVMAMPEGCGLFGPGDNPSGPVKVDHRNDGWVLTVGGKPFFVRGVCYNYVPVGEGGKYDTSGSRSKPWLEDGSLMKKMGANAVRIYQPAKDIEYTRTVIRDLFEKYGIKTALGHFLGFWNWPPVNYADAAFREKMKQEVLDMVKAFKDESGILFWIIGNENNYSFDRGVRDWTTPEIDLFDSPNARREAKAEIYYTFVNDIAKSIKEIDPDHPVVMGNGELISIDIAEKCCPDVDILGGIIYQGKTFGTYFQRLERNLGKPNVFIEFGADRYDAFTQEESQDWQAFFLKLQWLEIAQNMAGAKGTGNSLGGFVFEWCDEWWKHNPGYKLGWKTHDTSASWSNTAYYYDARARFNMNEEWFGVVGLDPKQTAGGIERRVPTKAYYALRSLWVAKESPGKTVYAVFAGIFLLFSTIMAVIVSRSR
ncbi:MAG: hypothetical protein ABH885_06305 [Candidatus Omnitrophota bacterium]